VPFITESLQGKFKARAVLLANGDGASDVPPANNAGSGRLERTDALRLSVPPGPGTLTGAFEHAWHVLLIPNSKKAFA
jgi:hypothetical protein